MGITLGINQRIAFVLSENEIHKQTSYALCTHSYAEYVYSAGRVLTKPMLHVFNLCTKLYNPRPGKCMEEATLCRKIWRLVQVAELVTLVIPICALLLASIGYCLRLFGCLFRPPATLLVNNELEVKSAEKEQTLHLMTYNTALMPSYIRNVNDMRSSVQRAKEIADQLLECDETEMPDCICLQECFSIEATKILCEALNKKYPYVLHSIAPNEVGLSSGLVVASKYKIIDIQYRPFSMAAREDALANKGLLGMTVDLGNDKHVRIYNTHLQAGDRKVQSTARFQQMEQVKQWVEEDARKGNYAGVFLSGDFNAAWVTQKGIRSHDYQKMENVFGPCFVNPYYQDYQDHFEQTTSRAPLFQDKKHPSGSWFDKPNGAWGTEKWDGKTLEEAVYDHIFLHQPKGQKTLPARSQIRFLEKEGSVSGSSDHLPVSCVVDISSI